MKVEEKSKKRLVAQCLLYTAMFLLGFVILNLVITSVMFIFRASVKPWYVILALVSDVVGMVLILRKRKLLNVKSVGLILVLPILAVAGLTWLNGEIYDSTYDGNYYHKLAIGMMMDGWNPLYETEAEFNEAAGGIIDLGGNDFHWGDYYAKASHIFGANVGTLTGDVESGKVLNDISVLVLVLTVLGICLYTEKSWWFAVGMTIVMATPTVVSAQFLTNYVDVLVYLYMFELAAIFFWFEYAEKMRAEVLAMFAMTLVMLINIKFSSFAYAGILCVFYYGWYIYRYFKDKSFDKKFFRNFTIVAAASVLVGVFVVGLSVYPKNLVEHGNPFYPLMGEGKIDIMTSNSPAYFKEKNNLERFFIATFSEMDNFAEASGLEAEYKVPFAINESELRWLGNSDVRISGNGIWFSGILIVAVIIVVVGVRKLFLENRKLFIMLALPIVMTLGLLVAMPDLWWARYFPQLHFIVFAALIMLDEYKNRFSRVALYGLMAIILVNNMSYFAGAVHVAYKYTSQTRQAVRNFKELNDSESCELVLGTGGFPGAYYSGRKDFGNYNLSYDYYGVGEEGKYANLMAPFLGGRCK